MGYTSFHLILLTIQNADPHFRNAGTETKKRTSFAQIYPASSGEAWTQNHAIEL